MEKGLALVTGATSGIGKAIATKLASSHRLIICGRREERLKKLQAELDTPCKILSFDITDKKAVYSAIGSLDKNWQTVDVLINNAGNAHGLATIDAGNDEDWDAMIDTNVKGLLYVSKPILSNMVAQRKGHIINIGSIAGNEVYPNGNVYCASKHAVAAITKSMRIDLNPHNIRVTAIDPGLVETEFSLVRFKGDKARASKTYQGLKPLSASDIADVIVFVINQPPHVTIATMEILPTAQASVYTLNKKLK